MIRISQLKCRPDHSEADLRKAIAKKCRLKEGTPFSYEILRQSIDARKKPEIFYVYTVDVSVPQEKQLLKKLKNDPSVTESTKKEYVFPIPSVSAEAASFSGQPVIVGAGPAGLFCGLMLARAGLKPIVLERGEDVDSRTRKVEIFWKENKLDTESNVQFGEGGAGTFSDGKLNSMIKDPSGRIRFVLQTFVEHGAGEDILYSYKPHIGTDVLARVVKQIRQEILSLGGEVWFRHKLVSFTENEDHSYELSIEKQTDEGTADTLKLHTKAVVLSPGHSARDTFDMLYRKGMDMHAKAFAVGVRVQHPQVWIDEAMYGTDCPYEMDAAPYKVTAAMPEGNAYSFCMCPGGYVVNASSEEGHLAVNGMSLHGRDSKYANSAIVVSVDPNEYKEYAADNDVPEPLKGIAFQRLLEKKAYEAGAGYIPAQRFGDYKADVPSKTSGEIAPCVKGNLTFTNIRPVFPPRMNQCIIGGMEQFGRKVKGFDHPDTLLYAVESRTSSPIRLERDQMCRSTSHQGIFPCGEGAGYAGGITSAAVDGIRVAEQIVKMYCGLD